MGGHGAAVLVLALSLSGCLQSGPDGKVATAAILDNLDPIVIALLDTGSSPYLPVFEVGDDSFVTATVPVPFGKMPITRTGEMEARFAADEAMWDSLEPGILYHFGGTRLLGISFERDTVAPYTRDGLGHGVGTSYVAARESPAAIIVAVQISTRTISSDPAHLAPVSMADGMEWIAAQDWIDVVSVSLGIPGNVPDRPELHNEMERFVSASEAAAASGKLVVVAAGNHLNSPLASYFAGTPWVIAVGGTEYNQSGEAVLSSLVGLDVTSNFTEWAPETTRGNMSWRSGTSLAAPVVSGTLAHALEIIRAQEPGRAVTAQELRDALNTTATMFAPTDWKPGPPGRIPLPYDLVQYQTLPILTQAQMGWGYIDGSMATEIARRVLEQDFAMPPGKEQAEVFQPRWQQAREDYWAAYRS